MNALLLKYRKRQQRVRRKLKKINSGLPRLTVFRSNQHIYAQIIDDLNSKTIISASTLDSEVSGKLKGKSKSNIEAAKLVGSLIAKRAKDKKIAQVVYDRGAYLYHGRVKALAEAFRAESGTKI